MDEVITICKEAEYFSRYELAAHLGNQEKARKMALATLLIYRRQSRTAHTKSENIWAEICGLKRDIKKMDADGIKVPLVEARVKKLEEELDTAKMELIRTGEKIYEMLDLWQSAGATFEDLCNLCNRDPAQVKKEIGDEHLTERFSTLATAYNLDYKDPRETGWIEDYIDAPLTHALKAFLVDTMLHTEPGRKAAVNGSDKM